MKNMLKQAARPPSILSALTKSVCRRVALVVFVTVVVLDAMVAVPVFISHTNEFVTDQATEAQVLFAAAVDTTRYPSIETLTLIGENLVRSTKVAGGIVLSGAGEDRAVFGTAPSLTWEDARLDGEVTRFDTETGEFDVFISPEHTQLPYGLILRLDVSKDWALMRQHELKLVIMQFVVAVVLSVLTALVVGTQVVRPLRTVRKAIDFALNAPEETSGLRTGVSRNDEIGELARSVDQLLFLTSTTFTDELAAALAILETSPHGIVTLSEQDHFVSANAAALKLFGERAFAGLLKRDPASLFRSGSETVTGVELAARGHLLGPGEILNKDGDFPCLIAGNTVNRSDGSVLRRYLIFVDMRDLVDQVRNEVLRRETAEQEVERLSGDLRLLRRMFDACLVITELDGGATNRSNAVTVQPEMMVDAWKARLKADGFAVPANVEPGDLPPVLGDPAELRRLFDTALEVVRLRSLSKDPHISISGRMDKGGALDIVILEIDKNGAEAGITSDIDMAILFGALGVLCRRQEGALTAMKGADDGNRLGIQLKVDVKTMDADSPESEAA